MCEFSVILCIDRSKQKGVLFMTFGANIKELRLKNNMTQEKLAELLNISPQAVSRWETGAAMPDISLLPPLATLFSVTTDFLLGMDTYQKDLRKAEFDEAFFEYWKHDDKQKNYEIAVQAVAEYPGNMEYVEWLASAEFYVAFEKEQDEFIRLLDSATKHYRVVLTSQPSPNLHSKALHGIVLSYHWKGDLESAKQYALTEEDETKRDDLLLWCLDGEEKCRHCQKMLDKKLTDLIVLLQNNGQQSMDVCNAIEQLITAVITDGNYQFYHNFLDYNSRRKAFLLCQNNRYDEAIEELKKARYHAEQDMLLSKQDRYQYTASLLNLLCGEKPVGDFTEIPLDNFKASLNNPVYTPIREQEDFKALLK